MNSKFRIFINDIVVYGREKSEMLHNKELQCQGTKYRVRHLTFSFSTNAYFVNGNA